MKIYFKKIEIIAEISEKPPNNSRKILIKLKENWSNFKEIPESFGKLENF